ncbi:MAG: glucosamine-6-phosphate isomerase [Planctomycetaceae bacterium]|nr:glucosamine-6-phosphate isomerase [Planctomycetaceae bacterium]
MTFSVPKYLRIPPTELGHDQPVALSILTDMASIARHMAQAMLREIENAREEGRRPTLIVPVGPVDQYPILAETVNRERISLRDVVLINMDEYLTDDDAWLPNDHPLCFSGFMNRRFYDLLDPELAPPPENRILPNPNDPGAVQRIIDERGGVDACFGGIGINGHIAFNEPPEPGETVSDEEFAERPTRVLSLSRETKTINSVTVGGDIAVVPERCVTVGMQEILAARVLRFYCNRPWQSGVVRRVLHGPITAACPASFLRTHPDASLTIADYVASMPDIRLR